MNYGREYLKKRRKEVCSNKKQMVRHVGVRFFQAVVLCVLLAVMMGAGGVVLFVKGIVSGSFSESLILAAC